jgi:hypothetical protein
MLYSTGLRLGIIILASAIENVHSLLERLPVITVIVFGQQSVNIIGLKTSHIGHIQIDEFGTQIIMDRIEKFHLLQRRMAISFRIIHHRTRTQHIIQCVLFIVRIERSQFEHARQTNNGNRIVFGRRGHQIAAGRGNQTSIGQDGMGGQDDLVDPCHDGKDGIVVNDTCVDASGGQGVGCYMAFVLGRTFANEDGEFQAFFTGGFEELKTRRIKSMVKSECMEHNRSSLAYNHKRHNISPFRQLNFVHTLE